MPVHRRGEQSTEGSDLPSVTSGECGADRLPRPCSDALPAVSASAPVPGREVEGLGGWFGSEPLAVE